MIIVLFVIMAFGFIMCVIKSNGSYNDGWEDLSIVMFVCCLFVVWL